METLIILLLLVAGISSGLETTTGGSCQLITIPMCKGIGYNYTSMPNQFNHDTQDEAGLEVHQYWPLVEIKCSMDLRFFICSLYVPICMADYKGSVPVCSSVCLRARMGCEPVMTQYGFQWPERMSCEKFPSYGNKKEICMDEKKGVLRGEAVRPPIQHNSTRSVNKCRAPLIPADGRNSSVCGLPCRFYDSSEEIKFANWWIALWSSLCAAITFITLLTFLIERNRFPYPERPIVYLSTCYLFVSSGYLIRVYKGHEAIACGADDDDSSNSSETTRRLLLGTSSSNPYCTLVFILIYYFGMASSIWWVMLSLTWYLAAVCKWGSEAIAKHFKTFHSIAWLVPFFGTVVALFLDPAAIDPDPVAGICGIGNQDGERLLAYVVCPLLLLLIVGTSFLLAGFMALFRIRRVISSQQGGRVKTEKLEKLMMRIGVYSILYTVPASAVIAAYFYEIKYKQLWHGCHDNKEQQAAGLGNVNKLMGGGGGCSSYKPVYSVLMIKYFMSLAVGITTGVWIWSGKTIETWQNFFTRFCTSSSTNAKTHV